MIKLFLKSGLSFEEKSCNKDTCTIGRAAECDVVIEKNGISRQHCVVKLDGDKALVTDLGSRNGTLVNGEKIEGEVEVKSGDTIRIGEAVFYYGEKPEVSDDQLFLEIIGGPNVGKRMEVGRDSIVIGRKGCDFTLDDDEGSSTRHAVIELGPAGYIVKDLGSRNGTWLKNNRAQTINLSENHIFRIGKTILFFGTDEQLARINKQKSNVMRDMLLQKLLPGIGAVLLIVTLVLVWKFRPDIFSDNKESWLAENASFESARAQSDLPTKWNLVFSPGLEGRLMQGGSHGKLCFRVAGNQAPDAKESRLVYEDAFGFGQRSFTVKASIKPELAMGTVQLGLIINGNGRSETLRGKSVCGTSGFQTLEQIFNLPEWAQSFQLCFIFSAIDGKAFVDDVYVYEENAMLKGSGYEIIGTDKSRLEIAPDGSFNLYSSDTEMLKNARLHIPGANGASSQWMGHLTRTEVKKALNEFTAEGLIYDFNANKLAPYSLVYKLEGKDWKVKYDMQSRQNLALAFQVPSEFTAVEAFGPSDNVVLISDNVQTAPVREICFTNSFRSSLVRDEDKSALLTHSSTLSLLESDAGDSVFPISFLATSPHYYRLVKNLLQEVQDNYTNGAYGKAVERSKVLADKYSNYEDEINASKKILAQINTKGKEALKEVQSEEKRLDAKDEQHWPKIEKLITVCRDHEKKFRGLPVAAEIKDIRDTLDKAVKGARMDQLNTAAKKVVAKCKAAIKSEQFALATILMGELQKKYTGTQSYQELPKLMKMLEEAKALKKAREEYVKNRYQEADNFENNNLKDAAKKIYNEILARYPGHKETIDRLKQLDANE